MVEQFVKEIRILYFYRVQSRVVIRCHLHINNMYGRKINGTCIKYSQKVPLQYKLKFNITMLYT